jgi:Flp pilus assembly protein CpaB
MRSKRVLASVIGALILASVAAAVVWQIAAAPNDPAPAGAVDSAPASQSIFPKVLNH